MSEIKQLTVKELKQFGLLLGFFVMLIFGFFIPWLWSFENIPNYYFVALGISISLFALILPSKVEYIYRPYMKFALIMGQIINTIILGVLFFVLFTIISLVIRIFRIDLLNNKYKNSEITYRINSDIPKNSHFERPF
tara:strand:- start:75 stop:485 length:411 start_codon:yes stop_codon:yes gene_type:complete